MGASRFPGQSVEGWQSGDAANCYRKDATEETQSFRQRLGPAIRIGDEIGRAPELARQVGCDESLCNVVQTCKRNAVRASAQSGQRAFHRRVAKQGLQSFADGR